MQNLPIDIIFILDYVLRNNYLFSGGMHTTHTENWFENCDVPLPLPAQADNRGAISLV
jgi:hypothetical protein